MWLYCTLYIWQVRTDYLCEKHIFWEIWIFCHFVTVLWRFLMFIRVQFSAQLKWFFHDLLISFSHLSDLCSAEQKRHFLVEATFILSKGNQDLDGPEFLVFQWKENRSHGVWSQWPLYILTPLTRGPLASYPKTTVSKVDFKLDWKIGAVVKSNFFHFRQLAKVNLFLCQQHFHLCYISTRLM